jgi:hypothetical protein
MNPPECYLRGAALNELEARVLSALPNPKGDIEALRENDGKMTIDRLLISRAIATIAAAGVCMLARNARYEPWHNVPWVLILRRAFAFGRRTHGDALLERRELPAVKGGS